MAYCAQKLTYYFFPNFPIIILPIILDLFSNHQLLFLNYSFNFTGSVTISYVQNADAQRKKNELSFYIITFDYSCIMLMNDVPNIPELCS